MPHDDASLSTANPELTVVERRVLARIFQHPLSHNLSWRETFELFRAIGSVEHVKNGNVVLNLGDDHLTFAPAHHKDLTADDVVALRHILTRAGRTPESAPVTVSKSAPRGLLIVIDHAGARVYPVEPDAGSALHEPHHLLHHIDRKQHDADREENYPADTRFFDAVAAAAEGKDQIIVVSHGKGQSNEGDHLLAYLATHHGAVHARIAERIVADLPHTTAPQLLALARKALQPAGDPAVSDAG